MATRGLANTGGNQDNGQPRKWYFINIARNSQCVLEISLSQGILNVFNSYRGTDCREELTTQAIRVDCNRRENIFGLLVIFQEIIRRAARTPSLLHNENSLVMTGHDESSVIFNRRVNNTIIDLLAFLREIAHKAPRAPAVQHRQESCALPEQHKSSIIFSRRVNVIGRFTMLRETVSRVGEMRRVPALLHRQKESVMLVQGILGLSPAHRAIRHCYDTSLSSRSSIMLNNKEAVTHCQRGLDTKGSDTNMTLMEKGPLNAHDIESGLNDDDKLNGTQGDRDKDNSQEVAPFKDSNLHELAYTVSDSEDESEDCAWMYSSDSENESMNGSDDGNNLVGNHDAMEDTAPQCDEILPGSNDTALVCGLSENERVNISEKEEDGQPMDSGLENVQGNASGFVNGQTKGHVNDCENYDLNGNANETADGYHVSSDSEDKNEDYDWMYSSDSENESMNESDDENSLIGNHDAMEGITPQCGEILPGSQEAALVSCLTENERVNIGKKEEDGQPMNSGLVNVHENASGFVNGQMKCYVNGQEYYDLDGNANELDDGYLASSDSEDANEDYDWIYRSDSESESLNESDDENGLVSSHDGMEGINPRGGKILPGSEGTAVVNCLTENERVKISKKKENGQPMNSGLGNVQRNASGFVNGQMKGYVNGRKNYDLNGNANELADDKSEDESEDNAGMHTHGSETENDSVDESDHEISPVGSHDGMEGIVAQQCPIVYKILPDVDDGIQGCGLTEQLGVSIENKQENDQRMETEQDNFQGNASGCANGQTKCDVNGAENCDLNDHVNYLVVYDSENENDDYASVCGSESGRDSRADNESNYDWMYSSDSENDSMYESETDMNHGEEGNNANNENAQIVPLLPGNAQQEHYHAAANHPVNPQGHPPGLQDEAPVAHMVHAVPNVAQIPQAYQPNPQQQDEAAVGEGAQQLPHVPNNAFMPPWLPDYILHAQAVLNGPPNLQEEQPNQGPQDEAPPGGNPHHLPIPQAQDPLPAGGDGNEMDANGGDHDEALPNGFGMPALAQPEVPQQGQLPQQGNQPEQGNPPQQGNQPQQVNQPQQAQATGPLSKLKAAARYVKQKLTRHHPPVPMYVPGAPREERTPLGLEEAPALVGVPMIPNGEDGGMHEEAQPRGLCACFAFLFRHHGNPVQEFPLQAEQVEEFEEQLAIVEPEMDAIEDVEVVEEPMEAADDQMEAIALPMEAF